MPKPQRTPEERRKTDLALIHAGAKKLGLDEAGRRQMYQTVCGPRVTSAADMTPTQRARVIAHLTAHGGLARQKPAAGPVKNVRRPVEPQSQDAKLLACWADLAKAGKVLHDTEPALNAWVLNQTGVAHYRWLSTAQASTCIERLKQWLRRPHTQSERK